MRFIRVPLITTLLLLAGCIYEAPLTREHFVHETDEVVIVVEGEMEFEIDGEISHPQAGEEIHIPAGAAHSVRNIGQSTARWLYGYRR